MANSGSFLGISAKWTVGTIASDDQPTQCKGQITAGQTTLWFSPFIRWCGYNQWTQNEIRSLMDALGVPVKDTTIMHQWRDGDLARRGYEPHHGPIPTSIRKSDVALLEAARIELSARPFTTQPAGTHNSSGLRPDEAADDSHSERNQYSPRETDERKIVERQIRERRGQQPFRNALRKRYGDRCLVTGCEILAVIEAAHICPYRGEIDHDPENGLLLRADIHTLFDLNLLGIDPGELRVSLHPSVASEYAEFDGVTLGCAGRDRPSNNALTKRYQEFSQKLLESH